MKISKTKTLNTKSSSMKISKTKTKTLKTQSSAMKISKTKTLNTKSSSMNIPIDLILEILWRASAKTIVRFRQTSKFWSSILKGRYFTKLFMIRSSARPRLLFALEGYSEWRFFSIPQPQNPYKNPSLIVTADFHMKVPRPRVMSRREYVGGPVSGFICLPNVRFPDKDNKNSLSVSVPVICNPSTGQYVRLPKGRDERDYFFGFDPTHKEFKVLSVPRTHPRRHELYELHVMTLRAENVTWRKMQCPVAHYAQSEGICIDGVLYYLDYQMMIVCFDVRSEKFTFIEGPRFRDGANPKLVNYKGKLGCISSGYVDTYHGYVLELYMWVLEKHKRSNNVYTLRENKFLKRARTYNNNVSIVGVTATGEIVMTLGCMFKPFYVLYFSPERNTLQSIEIQSFGANHEVYDQFTRVYAFLDYVEDLKFF